MAEPYHTIVETAEYLQAAERANLDDDDERPAIVDHLARNPNDGIALGGGLFKMRIARPGAGKRGGYSTVHFFGGSKLPVFLLTVYPKSFKATTTVSENKAMARYAQTIEEGYGGEDG